MAGTLIYLIGPSGSGKDTLINLARQTLGQEADVCFTHRYITRAASAGSENHVALTEEEFLARKRAGLFAMSWASHGCLYGIGIEINQWLAKGLTVVMNGSRGYLSTALQNYPELCPVLIEVSPEALRERLTQRGRESLEDIEQRLKRNHQLDISAEKHCLRVDNSHSPEVASKHLLAIINRHRSQGACA